MLHKETIYFKKVKILKQRIYPLKVSMVKHSPHSPFNIFTGGLNFCKWKVNVKMSVLNHVRLFVTPWTVAHQTPLSMEFSMQEYWVAVPFSRGSSQPRDRTQVSCITGRFFTTEPPGKWDMY